MGDIGIPWPPFHEGAPGVRCELLPAGAKLTELPQNPADAEHERFTQDQYEQMTRTGAHGVPGAPALSAGVWAKSTTCDQVAQQLTDIDFQIEAAIKVVVDAWPDDVGRQAATQIAMLAETAADLSQRVSCFAEGLSTIGSWVAQAEDDCIALSSQGANDMASELKAESEVQQSWGITVGDLAAFEAAGATPDQIALWEDLDHQRWLSFAAALKGINEGLDMMPTKILTAAPTNPFGADTPPPPQPKPTSTTTTPPPPPPLPPPNLPPLPPNPPWDPKAYLQGLGKFKNPAMPDLAHMGGGASLAGLGGAGGLGGLPHLGAGGVPPSLPTGGVPGGGAGAGFGAGASGAAELGAAAANAAKAGRGGMGAPGMGGGGGQGNDEDRERQTWLAEDDEVWGGTDAPPTVIS